jgi:hypothetical protein
LKTCLPATPGLSASGGRCAATSGYPTASWCGVALAATRATLRG